VQMRDELIRLGEKDALQDARDFLTRNSLAGAGGSDKEVLAAFREQLIAQNDGKWSTAKWKLERELEEKSKKLVGL
jgi:hypothetical protein